jgi:hypothetical protein
MLHLGNSFLNSKKRICCYTYLVGICIWLIFIARAQLIAIR